MVQASITYSIKRFNCRNKLVRLSADQPNIWEHGLNLVGPNVINFLQLQFTNVRNNLECFPLSDLSSLV
jgi:hypothetical protein